MQFQNHFYESFTCYAKNASPAIDTVPRAGLVYDYITLVACRLTRTNLAGSLHWPPLTMYSLKSLVILLLQTYEYQGTS